MFERNNIDDLFLATISVSYPDNDIVTDHVADFFTVSICSATEYSTILKKEGEKILSKIKDNDYVVTLEIEGNSLTSLEFAKKIDNNFGSNKNLTFVIGGSYGLDDLVKQRSDYKLSFSKFTFPHQLFRVILLEQIYRAYKINHNENYHK